MRFSKELPNDSPYAAREAIAGRDPRTLAREILGMSQEEFSGAFSKSPMKRAKLRGLKRNAAVVLGNPSAGSGQATLAEDVAALTRALDDEEPLVRSHSAWAIGRIGSPAAAAVLRARLDFEEDPDVRAALGAALGGDRV